MIFMSEEPDDLGQPWKSIGIEAPIGWHDALGDKAKRLKVTIRSLYFVAIDNVMGLSDRKIRDKARELSNLSHDDPLGFIRRHCDDETIVTEWKKEQVASAPAAILTAREARQSPKTKKTSEPAGSA